MWDFWLAKLPPCAGGHRAHECGNSLHRQAQANTTKSWLLNPHSPPKICWEQKELGTVMTTVAVRFCDDEGWELSRNSNWWNNQRKILPHSSSSPLTSARLLKHQFGDIKGICWFCSRATSHNCQNAIRGKSQINKTETAMGSWHEDKHEAGYQGQL